MHLPLADMEAKPAAADISVRELRATRPRLRRGLRVTFQDYSGGRYALVEDPLHSKFHQVGLPEYVFMTFLDGRRTISEAFARASLSAGGEAITEQEALVLTRWLVHNHLVDFDATTNEVAVEDADTRKKRRAMELSNFLFLRVPLGSPDWIFTASASVLGWLCHPVMWIPWLAVVLAGLWSVLWNWHRFQTMAGGVLNPQDGWVLLAIWAALKVVHEFGHGLVCKYYGCRVREAGFTFILFMPITYVDATASWALPSRWQRMHVTFGGLWVEVFVASLAALYWAHSQESFANTLAYKTVIIAGVTTVLFNLNPLMRFDGYYLLSDLLGMPNLYQRSNQAINRFCRRWLMSDPDVQEPVGVPEWERSVLLLYGIAALVWRVMTMAVLIIGASLMWRGGGLVLGLLCAVTWIGPGIWRFFAGLAPQEGWGASSRMRLIFRLALLLATLALVAFIPVYPMATAPGLVQVKDMVVLRAEAPGFINDVFVREGQTVSRGEWLVDVRNLQETNALRVLKLRLLYQEAKTAAALEAREREGGQSDVDVASFQAEEASLNALRKQTAEKAKMIASLRVEAPIDGTILTWKLAQRRGSYLNPGQEILRMGQVPATEIRLMIPQHAVDAFRARLGGRVEVYLPGRGETTAVLHRITSRGSRDIAFPELTALAGGPLAVVQRKEDSSAPRDDKGKDPYASYELLSPAFEAVAYFQDAPPEGIHTGEVVRTRFVSGESTPLWKVAAAWVEGAFRWLFHRARHEDGAVVDIQFKRGVIRHGLHGGEKARRYPTVVECRHPLHRTATLAVGGLLLGACRPC
ncbi:hypothetical protein DB346_21055 [Verrucomicrobia bacterium LW23]|nr:hypothetical protein DB346_21055 [Verrucomicrobia bacterium LW23]